VHGAHGAVIGDATTLGASGAPSGGTSSRFQWKMRVAMAWSREPGWAPGTVVDGPLSTTVIFSPVSRATTS
jgi:hypothetical protein